MSRILALAAGLWLCLALAIPADTYGFTQRSPDPGNTAARLSVDGGIPSTARALRRALLSRGLFASGRTWLGRFASVGHGKRDVLIFVPDNLDPRAAIELVVYMDGFRSFSDESMDRRHAAGIAKRLKRSDNFVYVAPDGPASVHHGNSSDKGLYWRANPARRGQARAPGDFVRFYQDLRAHLEPHLPTGGELELTLIGFSRGGLGVRSALDQLATSTGPVRLDTVNLRRVILADAFYNRSWLANIWKHTRGLPSLRELALIVPLQNRRSRMRVDQFITSRPEIGVRSPGARVAWRRGVLSYQMVRGRHRDLGDLGVHYQTPAVAASR